MLLKDYISPLVCNKMVSKALEVQQPQIDNVIANINDLTNQGFIESATWSLDLWEEEFGIKSKLNDTLENRRNLVLAKKRGTGTTTVGTVKNVCNSFVDKTTVTEYSNEYYFDLLLESYNGFHNYLEDLMEIIEDLKPAHLNVNYHLKAITQSNLYIASVGFTSEIINVYPWTPSNLESKLDVYIPSHQPSSLESINVYPKEAI
ncbi:uncharacterized protein YmfQ (DUF2313 family) [Clostridium saccharoperbutylacetonicum]|uniref:Putative phage protein XkdU n=1 Tax=Clostridium saccharoperbutylacetonicum N1-4(HMT) TaxID=931276 RepID=M1MJH1_9CLOT|nr:putative phage tail protein [Clostridium saccharoperbutylacetonicum]AGF56473.1 putative phage protein XkdU [Clostridium saccharoperbutylacetonicum N1-4(HMT)]NRT62780.1 uncharacterized protein YmfQ (DUF2313 family) [Clostridium saccharoperbutylacetonicum]NSB26133.1 uncharacterized protein YmfQ (DUF2313 family) [Clostridium saccharoperbutylacetonicum]NSB45487.1 uncharacterized protein YmfQ (DUF2313 family) [Clostridium saccharoperbutylacetonicum]